MIIITTNKMLEEREWLKRDIDTSERTPFPTYHAVNTGRKVNEAIGLHALSAGTLSSR